jgi:hypothetical protein
LDCSTIVLAPYAAIGLGRRGLQETMSLYLELEPGENPDFEVVGLAAAAFAETVKSRIIALLPRFRSQRFL